MPIPASFDLSGRVALAAGAGSPDGIGFAAARLLAELGAAVMIGATTSRIHDRVSELRGGGFDAAGAAGDLTHPGAASALVSAALDRWGRLDIVVNNAGMISAAVPMFESGTLDSMDEATCIHHCAPEVPFQELSHSLRGIRLNMIPSNDPAGRRDPPVSWGRSTARG